MKKLKLIELSNQEKFNNNELKNLKGGASSSGIFGWCSCPCSCCCDNCTGSRANVRCSDNSSTCRCTDKKSDSISSNVPMF